MLWIVSNNFPGMCLVETKTHGKNKSITYLSAAEPFLEAYNCPYLQATPASLTYEIS
jgi:hypothetical protein